MTTRHGVKVKAVRSFGKKADRNRYQHALLGHPNGTLTIADKPGYGWARIGGQNGRVVIVYLRGVLPAYDLPVVVAPLPHRPQDYGVVDLDVEGFAGSGSGESATGYSGTAYVQAHAAQHNYLGGDQTYTHIRQWRPLRVYPYTGFNIYCEQGFIIRNGVRINVSAQVVDLTSHVPASGARYVLITINPGGILTATSGTDVAGVLDLTLANIPTTPVGHYPLAAVRTYAAQSSIRETQSVTDIVDLRYPQEFAASSPVMYETVTNGDAGALSIGMPVYLSAAGTVKKAKGDAASTSLVAGLMTGTVASSATGEMQLNGQLTATTAQWDALTGGSGGLTAGAYYYISAATAGLITSTSTSDPDQFPVKIGLALSTTVMLIDIDPSNNVVTGGDNTALDDVATIGDTGCNYTSIATAVADADLGRLLLVTPGTYSGAVTHSRADELDLTSLQQLGQLAILSYASGVALTLSSGAATISNLKITGGNGTDPTISATSTGAGTFLQFMACDIQTASTNVFGNTGSNYYWTWFNDCRLVGNIAIKETAYFSNCLIYGNVVLSAGAGNAYNDPELSTPLVEIRGGKIIGNLTIGAGVTVLMKNLPQITGTVSNSGTIVGKYQNSAGNIVSLVGGADGAVQYNDAGFLAGIPLLYDDSTAFLTRLKSPAPGFAFPGDSIKIEAGSTAGGTTTDGGDFEIIAGSAGNTGAGGDATITAGDSAASGGGNVVLRPGSGGTGNGVTEIVDPTSDLAAIFDTSGITTANKTFAFPDASGTLALTDQLVTNGDSHDHSGGDGAQIDHTTLSNIGTNTHAQIDSALAALETVTWTDYSATSTIVGWSSFTTKKIYYKKIGKRVFGSVFLSGTSNSTSITFTLPYTSESGSYIVESGQAVDNGAAKTSPGLLYMAEGQSTANGYLDFSGAAWTASGTKAILGQFSYEATS